jgi:AcrR family transcriptional regulator
MPSVEAGSGSTIAAPAGTEPVRRGRGRPRRTIDEAVLIATTERLRVVGARRTTIDAIAARSNCSKTAIYRRWPTRDAILLDALRRATFGRPDDVRDVVEIERELRSTVHAAAIRGSMIFASEIMLAVLPTITREVLSASPIGEAFRHEIFRPIRAAAKERLQAAIDRGEVSDDVDADLVFDMAYGTMLYRALMGEPVDATVAGVLADLMMHGVAGPERASDRTRRRSTRPTRISPRHRAARP